MRYTSFLGQGVMIGAICMTGLLSACGDKEPATQNIVNTDSTNTKTIKVAVNSGMSPFAYIDEKGNPIGFDVELITHIAQKNGYAVKFNVLPWQEMFKSVEQGTSDLAISSISYSTEREGKYLLSNPYVYMPAGILSLDGTTINSISDLKPMRLGMQDGAIFMDIAKENGIEQVMTKEKIFLSFQDLINGKVDAIISDKQIIQHLAKSYPEYKTNILEYGDASNKGSYAVAIAPKGKTQVIEMFNQGVAEMKTSGELAQLETKWFENNGNKPN
ncbi:substrate-binding periplasmic protein [Moraxella bovis]|uniref:substrate-binding periplasmic protein n=1 Tax=Moraxella bovis TaxID=476 RepID=UPI002226F0C0|nr:transporter substrate-binding domain-containing protein [Moraxella bovis]UYZ80365.1 transporter substrate-binding domain-containing protein [Moraxella bovis]